MRVFRIQDCHGRGPFIPGFSAQWADETFRDCTAPLPTWMDEFGADLLDRLGLPGEFFGSAVRSANQISRWFSAREQARLASLGFHVVKLNVDRILAESENQLVFARRRPLSRGAKILRRAA